MKSEDYAGEAASGVRFLVVKSYDGGKNWEAARRCENFIAAAGAAQALRIEHPSIRFRVDVEAAGRRTRRSRRAGLRGGV
jgi:hypothetical protein